MKRCQKCETVYPDTENFCTECGTALAAVSPQTAEDHERLARGMEKISSRLDSVENRVDAFRDEVSEGSSSAISKVSGRVRSLEKHLSRKTIPEKGEGDTSLAASISSLENRVKDIERSARKAADLGGLEARLSVLERRIEGVGKEALRVAKAKHMPGDDAVSIVSGMGELEHRVDAVEAALEGLPRQGLLRAENRLDSLADDIKSMKAGMKSFTGMLKESEAESGSVESRLRGFAKYSDLAELRKTLSMENEKIEARLDEISSVRSGMEKSIASAHKALRSGSGSESRRIGGWISKAEGRFATREQIDSLMDDIDARVEKGLKPLDNFREKVMVIAGLAMEQHEKSKELKSGIIGLVEKRLKQMESSFSSKTDQAMARIDNELASRTNEVSEVRARVEGDMAAINDSISRIEEFENRIKGEMEAMKESAALKQDIESVKDAIESFNARFSTLKQMLAAHTKSIDELSQAKAQTEDEREHAMDELNARINEAMQEIRSQGNSIVADMEKKMMNAIDTGLRGISDMRSKMDGEMKLVLDTLSRSQGFDKAVESELSALKAEFGRLDEKVKSAVAEEKGALDSAISSELKRLQKIGRDAEQKLDIMKESWDRAIKETVRKNVDEFERLRKMYSGSAERMNQADSGVKSVIEKAMKSAEGRMQEESRRNSSMRREFESTLKDMRITNRDSQEKLAMVKEFISNTEQRLGSEIEGLERRLDRVSKIQQKLELEGLSPKRRAK